MEKNNYNWFLTAIANNDCHRTFGFYKEYSNALEAVTTNRCNMHEYLYEYLVMEKIGEGIHPPVTEEHWFMWDDRNQKWIPWEKLHKYRNITNWALG